MGLFRRSWVLFSFALTALSTLVLLGHMPAVTAQAGVARDAEGASAHRGVLRIKRSFRWGLWGTVAGVVLKPQASTGQARLGGRSARWSASHGRVLPWHDETTPAPRPPAT